MKKNKLLTRNKKQSVPKAEDKTNDKKKTLVKEIHLYSGKGTTKVAIDKIIMAMTKDHKLKVLVDFSPPEWLERNDSLHNFFSLLPPGKFQKISKFYIINWDYMPSYASKKKTLTFSNNFTYELEHKIKLSVFKDRQ